MREDLERRVSLAVDHFMEGFGCCQSVVLAFSDLYGLDSQLAKRVSAGFGGGVGRLRLMCGAVSALVILNESMMHRHPERSVAKSKDPVKS